MSDNEEQEQAFTVNENSDVSQETVDALNKEADDVWEAVEETRREVTRMAESVKALPNLNRLVALCSQNMTQDMFHRVMNHGTDPTQAGIDVTEEYFARMFLAGYHFARAGHTIIEVDGVPDDEPDEPEGPDRSKANWN